MSVNLSSIQIDGTLRVNQGENRDIEFNIYPNTFVVEDFGKTFFNYLVNVFNNETNPQGYKLVIEDENGNKVLETDQKLFDLYETEQYYVAELDLSYQDSEDPTEDRHIYKVKLVVVDENSNEIVLITSNAPQSNVFSEDIGDGKKAVVIHASDGKATINGIVRLFIQK
jgi:hypothetical protein